MNNLSQKKKLKKVIAVLLRSTIMNRWELEAILQLLQVMQRSKSSKIFGKSSIRANNRNSKLKYKIFLLFINNFSQNAFWNLKPFNQPARQIRTPLHCECNISVTMAGIIKWLGYTIHRMHGYSWFKFEDLTSTGLDFGEHQSLCNLKCPVVYSKRDGGERGRQLKLWREG